MRKSEKSGCRAVLPKYDESVKAVLIPCRLTNHQL